MTLNIGEDLRYDVNDRDGYTLINTSRSRAWHIYAGDPMELNKQPLCRYRTRRHWMGPKHGWNKRMVEAAPLCKKCKVRYLALLRKGQR